MTTETLVIILALLVILSYLVDKAIPSPFTNGYRDAKSFADKYRTELFIAILLVYLSLIGHIIYTVYPYLQ